MSAAVFRRCCVLMTCWRAREIGELNTSTQRTAQRPRATPGATLSAQWPDERAPSHESEYDGESGQHTIRRGQRDSQTFELTPLLRISC